MENIIDKGSFNNNKTAFSPGSSGSSLLGQKEERDDLSPGQWRRTFAEWQNQSGVDAFLLQMGKDLQGKVIVNVG